MTVCVAFLVWRLSIVGEYHWGHDEGAYISAAWMVSQGSALYHETMTSSPPLFIHVLSVAMSILGPSVLTARLVIVAFLFVGFVALGLVARELDGWPAAIVAPLMFVVIPDVMDQSTLAFSTLPAVCLIMVAVLGKMVYFRTGQRGWLVLAGAMTAAGLLTKLVVLFALPFPFITVLLRHSWQDHAPGHAASNAWPRDILIDSLVAYASLLLPLVLYVLAIGPRAVFDNVIQFQLEGRVDDPTWLMGNLNQMGGVLRTQPILIALAGFGSLRLYRTRPFRNALVVAGIVAAATFMMSHSPLYEHHAVALFFPLSVLAGVGVIAACKSCRSLLRSSTRRLNARNLLPIGLLGLFVISLPGYIRRDRAAIELIHTPDESEGVAIHFLQETTGPDDLIFSDEPMLPLLADRQILPSLTEVSWKRLRVGDVSADAMIELTEKHRPAAIVIWKERFEDSPYDAWVQTHYHLAHLDSSSHRIYLRSAAAIPRDRLLTDDLEMLGYNYDVEESQPGQLQLKLSLFWRPLSPEGAPKLDLKIMNSGFQVFGATSGVFNWAADWERNEHEFIPDSRVIDILPGTPPGEYQLCVAHFGSRDEPDDELFVGPIVIPRGSYRPETLDLAHSLDGQLGDRISLLGYRATDVHIRPGDSIHLSLFWRALAEITLDYTVFVHLVDSQGRIVSQRDSQPVGGFHPTSRWERDEIVRDPHDLTIPLQAPAGPYRLQVGMYDTQTRIPLTATGSDSLGQANAVLLDAVR